MDTNDVPPPLQSADELTNLLQIIGGTTEQLENIWGGREESGKYLAMLRESVDRAAKLTADIVEQAGGAKNGAGVLPERTARSRPVPSATSRKGRIMIVDDEPMMRTLCETLLVQEGYEVLTVESGCKALAIFARDKDACDAVVLDYAMPFMNGEETYRRLRAISRDLPVILATGFIDHDVLDRLLRDGLTALIRKPVPPDELLRCVEAALTGEHHLVGQSSAIRGIAAAL